MVGGDGCERLPVPERVCEEEAVIRGDSGVAARAVDGDVDEADVGDVVGRVRVCGLQPAGGGEVVEVVCDAGVGFTGGDFVGDGGGEEGGGRVRQAGEAPAGEVDVEAVPCGNEVEIAYRGVVPAEHSVVGEPEELSDVGDVLVGRDVVGAEREVAARGAAVPRRGGRRRGQEEEEQAEERSFHGSGTLAGGAGEAWHHSTVCSQRGWVGSD